MYISIIFLFFILLFTKDQLQALYQEAPSIDTRIIANILSCATTLVTQDSANIGIPDFPLDNLTSAMSILEKVNF